jgi:hypothetical protein
MTAKERSRLASADVAGSIPAFSTGMWRRGSALASGARGRPFESAHSDMTGCGLAVKAPRWGRGERWFESGQPDRDVA